MNRITARALIVLVVSAAISLSAVSAAHAADGSATISGHIAHEGGAPIPSYYSIYVYACPVGGGGVDSGDCEIGGSVHPTYDYSFSVDAGVDYTLCVNAGAFTDVVRECWNDGATVTLVADQQLDIDWEIVVGGHLTGSVSYFSPYNGAVIGANGTEVALLRLDEGDGAYQFYGQTQVPPGYPGFTFYALPPGTYAVYFLATSAFQNELLLNSEYWDDARYWAERTDLVVEVGDQLDLGDVLLSPRSLDVSRIQGPDRFDVGVSVSRELYPVGEVPVGGVPIVYVANGHNFPDALTAGPAASLQGGSVLLVEPTSIPPAVAAELTRLSPKRIVVAGGPASVSPSVFEKLQGFVASPSDVVRAGGLDRYEASRAVVRDAFEAVGADIAIIATGANFPDALSAGPAAASQAGPVMLVDGSATSIDNATRQLIQDLGIQRIYIAGGTGSVSTGIETSLKSLLGDAEVVRFAGADRFEVGVLISQEFFSTSEYAFVTTGFKFPDALTGGPLAAAAGAPLYLSRPECLPPDVAFDFLDLDAQGVVLLGGPGSLSLAVEQLELC